MRLATITNWAYVATVVLTLASGATAIVASLAQDRERAAVAQRHELDRASSKVATEVTALSAQARDYIITGDTAHLEVYRREAEALTEIEGRIQRIQQLGAGADGIDAIAEAIRSADALQDEQRRAIDARVQGDEDLGRRILFGADYERKLGHIADQIELFQSDIDQNTEQQIAVAANAAKAWRSGSEIALGATGILFLYVLYFVVKRRILRPVLRLSDVISRLAAQDYAAEPPVYGEIDEIGDITQALRIFRQNGMERQRLEKQLGADLVMRALLSRMTQRMQECETISQLEMVIESFVPEIVDGFAGRLYLLDEKRNILVERCSWLAPVHSPAEVVPSSCWALQRGELHRPKGDAIDVPCEHLGPEKRSIDYICLPLTAQRATVGLLYLEAINGQARSQATSSELYLKMLAENIALAIGNLRLRDALREMAMADPLTGLANRRQLEVALAYRLAEADKLGLPISCLMLDVDHFKRFNDEFGHDAGDVVLRAVGDLLKHSTREGDLAFRYGGEEFLLLMPGLGAEKAVQRAEELRSRIGMLRVEHGGHKLGPITASLGVATAPELCGFDELIRTADVALLRAKAAGRDRVVLAEHALPVANSPS